MRPDYQADERGANGCRCLLLSAFISAHGWRVVFPGVRGSFPNSLPSSNPGGWTGNPADKWGRHRRTPDLVWTLPLNLSEWPPIGSVNEWWDWAQNAMRVLPPPEPCPVLCVQVSCAHHSMSEIGPGGTLTELFLECVNRYRATHRRVVCRLPLKSA